MTGGANARGLPEKITGFRERGGAESWVPETAKTAVISPPRFGLEPLTFRASCGGWISNPASDHRPVPVSVSMASR